MSQKDSTRDRFNADAKAYEDRIIKHVNGYLDMHQSILNFIPFKPGDSFKVLDLGIGSGRLAEQILKTFPKATLTGTDFSEKMIEMSKARLASFEGRIKFSIADFEKELPAEKFNVIIMVLSLHHLEDPGKKALIAKLYDKLLTPGALLIGDLTKSRSQRITDIYMNLWRQNLRNNGYTDEYIEKCYQEKYQTEDIPGTLEDHLQWLKDAEFEQIEVFWKRNHFVAFGGFKGLA